MEEPGVVGHMELDEEEQKNVVEDEPVSQETVLESDEQDPVEPEIDRPISSDSSFVRRGLSSSPEEDVLPSWRTAEEEESRSKSIWTNFDNGHS
jgi:hypothetical protein